MRQQFLCLTAPNPATHPRGQRGSVKCGSERWALNPSSVNVRLIGPALLPMPGETLLYNAGTIELEVAPDGSVTLLRRVGHSIDVCAILG